MEDDKSMTYLWQEGRASCSCMPSVAIGASLTPAAVERFTRTALVAIPTCTGGGMTGSQECNKDNRAKEIDKAKGFSVRGGQRGRQG